MKTALSSNLFNSFLIGVSKLDIPKFEIKFHLYMIEKKNSTQYPCGRVK